MKYVKIQFSTDDACAKALHALMQRGKVTGLRDRVLLVPSPALDVLNQEQIPHTVLAWMDHDHVVQALRDSVADPVQ